MNDDNHPYSQLAGYQLELYPPDQQQAIAHHVRTCSECQRFLESLTVTVELLRLLPAPSLPRSFTLPNDEPILLTFQKRLRLLSTFAAILFFVVAITLTLLPSFLMPSPAQLPSPVHQSTLVSVPTPQLVSPPVSAANRMATPTHSTTTKMPSFSAAHTSKISPSTVTLKKGGSNSAIALALALSAGLLLLLANATNLREDAQP